MPNNNKQTRSFRRRDLKKEVKKEIRRDLKQPPRQNRRARRRRQNNNNGRRNNTMFQEIGSELGGVVGMRGLGRAAGTVVSRIFGQGDYRMAGENLSSMPPSFAPLGSGVRISHREYISDVNGSTAFTSTTYNLNPGLHSSFPWLSAIASNFESYRIHGIVVYLKTNSATAVASTNTALGVWGVVTQYDVTDADFTSKQECENYMGCSSSVPSCSVLHQVECQKRSNVMSNLYVRTGAITEDLKFYDMAKFQVFAQGMQEASNIGELWISYDIEFFKPRLPSGGVIGYTDTYYLETGFGNANPFGSFTGTASGSIGSQIVDSTHIHIPALAPLGTYLFWINWVGSSTVVATNPVITVSGSLALKLYFNGGTAEYMPGPESGRTCSRTGFAFTFVKTTLQQGVITLGVGGTLPTSPMTANVVITFLDSESVVAPGVSGFTNKEVVRLKKFLSLMPEIKEEPPNEEEDYVL